jgi:hypothetical protein
MKEGKVKRKHVKQKTKTRKEIFINQFHSFHPEGASK